MMLLLLGGKKKDMRPIQKLVNAVKTVNFLRRTVQSGNESLLELTKFALLKPNRSRTQGDLESIERMMGKFKFFQEFKHSQGQTIFSEFCTQLNYRYSGVGEKVIKKGQIGQTFFVLLKGSVGVLIYNPKTPEAKRQVVQQQSLLNKGQNLVPDYDNPDLFECMEIAVLESGATFGDLALLQNNSITSATIITKKPCEFAVMDRRAFWKYSGKHKQIELDLKLANLKQLPFLEGWYELDLKTISFEFKTVKYYKGQVICTQGKTRTGLFMIIEGQVLLQRSKVSNVNDPDDLMLRVQQGQVIKVSVLSPPYYFGDGFGQTFEHTAICESQSVTLYFISRNDLDKRLNWNPHSKAIYEQISKSHDTFYRWRQAEVEAHLPMKQHLVGNDGRQISVAEIKACLSLPTANPTPLTVSHPARLSEHVSWAEKRVNKIDFMSACEVLDQSVLLEEDFNKQHPETTVPRLKLKPDLQYLGTTQNVKSFKENQRRERMLKLRFEMQLQRMMEHEEKKRQAIKKQKVQEGDQRHMKSSQSQADIQKPMEFSTRRKLQSQQSATPASESVLCVRSSKLFRVVIKRKVVDDHIPKTSRCEELSRNSSLAPRQLEGQLLTLKNQNFIRHIFKTKPKAQSYKL